MKIDKEDSGSLDNRGNITILNKRINLEVFFFGSGVKASATPTAGESCAAEPDVPGLEMVCFLSFETMISCDL